MIRAFRTRSSRPSSILRFPVALGALWAAFPLMTWAVPQQQYNGCTETFSTGNFVCTPIDISGTYKRLVSGDVSGDWSPEIATIKGSTLIVCHDADTHNSAVGVAQGAVDLCYVDDWNGLGTPASPAILYTGAGGLYRVTYHPEQELRYVSDIVSSDPLWVDAPILRTVSDVSGSVNEIFGVAASAHPRTVFHSTLQANGFSAPAPLPPVAYDILDIAPVEWDGDSQSEIAVFQTNCVQVREQDGTTKMSRAIAANTGYAIAVVKRSLNTDSLAFATYLSGGPKLLLFNKNFTTQMTAITAPFTAIDSMVAADLNPDVLEHKDDLVLASSSSSKLHILRCGSSAPWFQEPGQAEDVDMSLDLVPHPSSGKVLCANLFNHWNQDELPIPAFAIALPDADGVRMLPQLNGLAPSTSDFTAPVTYWSACSQSTTHSQWKVTLGGGWGLTNANRLEMIVRKCETEETVSEEAVFRYGLQEINSGEIAGKYFIFNGVETVNTEDVSGVRYFVAVRPFKVNDSQAIVRVWRWSVLGVSASCPGFDALSDLPGAHGPLVGIGSQTCVPNILDCVSSVFGNYVLFGVPLSEIPGGPWTQPDPPSQ